MLHLDLAEFQEAFDVNWIDWCKGGPRDGGYTRAGVEVPCVPRWLRFSRKTDISIEDALAKNREEAERWHLGFLKDHSDLEHTPYYLEYLNPRYNTESVRRANEFLFLFDDVLNNGVKSPIWIADLGDRCFRFDGCHRTCCAKICGHNTVPALVFTA